MKNWHHRESNPRPCGLYCSASTYCATACPALRHYLPFTLTAMATEGIDKSMEKTQYCRLCVVRSSVKQKTGKNIIFPYELRQSGKWLTVVSLQIYRTVPRRGSHSLTSVLGAAAMLKCSQWLRAIRRSINQPTRVNDSHYGYVIFLPATIPTPLRMIK